MIHILTIGLSIVGLVLALFNLPGVWLVFVAFWSYAAYSNFSVITTGNLFVLLTASIVITMLDNIVTPIGASKFGASKWGIGGAILGGLVGTIFGGPVGMIIGPLLGATLFEAVFEKKEMKAALKSGFGAFLGFLSSVVLKFGGVLAMVIWGLTKIY